MIALLKYKNITLAALITGSIFTLSGCVHPSETAFKNAVTPGHHQPPSTTIKPEQASSAKRENINNADQRQPAVSETTLRKSNISRNKILLAEIKKQNYTQYDNNFYFKVLKQ